MFPHGGRSTGILGGSRLVVGLLVFVAVLTVLGLIAPSVAGAPSVANGTAGAPAPAAPPVSQAGPTPADSTPPSIYYFSASPPEFALGGGTYINAYAYSPIGDPINYAYTGLPSGCVSYGSYVPFCTPTASGAYNITVTVTDTVNLVSATSQTDVLVLPVLNGTFFSVNPNVIQTYGVGFTEYGLPYGMSWSVTIGGDNVSSTSSYLQFIEMGGDYTYSVGGVPGYGVSPGSVGTVLLQGTWANVTLYYFPTSSGVSVSFSETGLPNGAPWTVIFGPYLESSTYSSFSAFVPAGVYDYSVDLIDHEAATPSSGLVFAFGSASVSISFTPYPITVYPLVISEVGLPFGTQWSLSLNGTALLSTVSSVGLNFTDGKYPYTISDLPGYAPSTTHGKLTIADAPESLTVTFTALPPPPTYPITVTENGLPAGTPWTAYVAGVGYSSSSPSVSAYETNGSYPYSIGSSSVAISGFVVAPANGTVVVAGASTSVNVTFSPVAELQPGTAGCAPSTASPPFYSNSCYPEALSPTLLSLENGTVLGLASQLYTQTTSSSCPNAVNTTNARVGFQISTNDGASFSPALSLGNDASCKFTNAIEPSFAASGANVYGTYIEENSTNLSFQYGDRAGDALGFISSANSGSTFSPSRTIDYSGHLARPAVAAFGSFVYIVFENIANSSSSIGGGVLPISLDYLWSANRGVSWSSVSTLPGLGPGEGYNAMAPSIAVSASGAVAVAYATDRTCEYVGSSGCAAYSDSIVDVTSTDNGTNWQGPSVVATGAGESACFTGACLGSFFQSTPQTAVAYDPASGYLYVAYAATYDQGIGANSQNFNHTGIFADYSADGGQTWAGGGVAAPMGGSSERSFNPGLGVSSQGVYLTYLQANESAGSAALANSLSQWVVTAPAGAPLAWTSPTVIDVDSFALTGGAVNTTESSFAGYTSDVAFNATGVPWVAFALPAAPTTVITSSSSYYYVNTTFPTSLAVGSLAVAGSADTVEVNFTVSGLPNGTPWTFYINGISYALNVPSIIFENIPLGATMLVGAYYVPTGAWTIVSNWYNATTTSFDYNQTYYFTYNVLVGYEWNFFPSNQGFWTTYNELFMYLYVFVFSPTFFYIDLDVEDLGNFEDIFSESSLAVDNLDEFCTPVCNFTTPFYFPIGTPLMWQINDYPYESLPLLYFTGTGAGSYTGPVSGYCEYEYEGECEETVENLDLTMDSAVLETFWLGDAPENLDASVSFSSPGLPSDSTFYATVNGTVVSGTPSSPGVVPNMAPGAYTVSNIWATSSVPGWEYFGSVSGPNPFVSPIETSVNLEFDAFVNLSAAPGTVTFAAPGVATGTTWSLTFNGTTYTSSIPWINVTTRPGTFTLSVGNAIAADGTTGYLPTTPAGTISVVPGGTYPIAYTPAFEVIVEASTGGLVSVDHSTQSSLIKTWVGTGGSIPISEAPLAGYTFAGWAGSGPGSYTGTSATADLTVTGPVVESASYLPLPGARFNLTFDATGLAAGTWWTVDLNGVGYSSDSASMTVTGLYAWSSGVQGHYNLTVPTAYSNTTNLTRYVPGGFPGEVGANSTLNAPINVFFAAEVQVGVTYTGEGTVATTYNGAPTGTSVWADLGSPVTITAAPYPGWTFAGWEGTGYGAYTGPNATYVVTPGGAVSEIAVFNQVAVTQAVTYSVTFTLGTTLAAGTSWGVTLGGVGYTTTTSSLTIGNVSSATYAMQVSTATAASGLVQYRPSATDPVALTVDRNTTISVSYVSYYYIGVSASVGGTVSPGPGWYASGSVLYLVATANSSDTFASWTGTGAGSYSGPNATAALIVSGPVSEVATFQSSNAAAAAASVWSNPTTWLGIGGAALVVGIVAGVVIARLGTRPAAPSTGARGVAPPSNPPANGGVP